VNVCAGVARLPPPGKLFGQEFPAAHQGLLLLEDIAVLIVQDGVVAYNALGQLPRGCTLNIARPCSGRTKSCH
jgi:hypothetical protein